MADACRKIHGYGYWLATCCLWSQIEELSVSAQRGARSQATSTEARPNAAFQIEARSVPGRLSCTVPGLWPGCSRGSAGCQVVPDQRQVIAQHQLVRPGDGRVIMTDAGLTAVDPTVAQRHARQQVVAATGPFAWHSVPGEAGTFQADEGAGNRSSGGVSVFCSGVRSGIAESAAVAISLNAECAPPKINQLPTA